MEIKKIEFTEKEKAILSQLEKSNSEILRAFMIDESKFEEHMKQAGVTGITKE